MPKLKVNDKVTFIGYDGMESIDTVYDKWESKDGQWIELTQNEVVLSPEKQQEIGLKKFSK